VGIVRAVPSPGERLSGRTCICGSNSPLGCGHERAAKDAGLKPGMKLYVLDGPGRGTDARVTRVGDASAEAEATFLGKHQPKPGWKMSTRVMP